MMISAVRWAVVAVLFGSSSGDRVESRASESRDGFPGHATVHRTDLLGGHDSARPAASECGNRHISQCTELLEALTKKEIGFAATLQELNEMCPFLMKGLQCIDNYTLRCLNPQHRSYFNELYTGTIHVIKDLCNARGPYQKEYIRHAHCMRQVHPKYNECSEIYQAKTAPLNEVNSAVVTLSEEDRMKKVITLCCSFQEYLQCSESIVYETCGNATATFTRNFLYRMAGPIVRTNCMKYEPGGELCLSASSSGSLFAIKFLVFTSSISSVMLFSPSWLPSVMFL